MKTITVAALALVSLLISFVASATDVKTLPGSGCRPAADWLTRGGFLTPSTGQPLASPAMFGIGVNVFFVDSNAPYPSINTASCALTRDYTNNLNGLSFVKVWVVDSSSTTQVSCTVLTSSPDLSQTFTSQTLSTGTAFVTTPGQSTLLTFTSSMVNQSWVHGFATVTCTMNKGDELRTLNWGEFGAGDPN